MNGLACTNPDPTISVVICSFTLERWDDLCGAVESVEAQTVAPFEIVVVVDHNPQLLRRAAERFPGARVVESVGAPGISAARTTAVAVAASEIIAFLDDDAAAEPDWLERIRNHYADDRVLGVGGYIEAVWDEDRPRWFPREFDWVVGCSFLGMPTETAPVRNLIAANMSTRRDAFLAAGGGFREDVGRLKRVPVGCEETEMCIRIGQLFPEGVFLHDPAVQVRHRVRGARSRWRYFLSRCYGEGISKATVARSVGAKDGLSWERRYASRVLPRGVLRELRAGLTLRDVSGFARAAAIVSGLTAAAAGFVAGTSARILRRAPQGSTGGSRPTPVPAAPLRLLVVTPRFLPEMGGVENHVDQVTRRLQGDAEITVLTTDTSGRLPAEETVDGYRVLRVRARPRGRDWRFAPSVYRLVRDGGWDLVHVQSYHTAVAPLAMLAAGRARIPYVVTFHGGGHSSRLRTVLRRPQWALLRPLFARAERLIAVASFEADFFSRRLSIPAERFAVIPNGSDLPALETAPGVPTNGRRIIASIGRLERYKGHHRVVAAMPRVLAQEPDVELRIVGSGPYRKHIERLSHRLGIDDRVVIESIPPSDRAAMAAALRRFSGVVLMSEFETHPLAVIEAAAAGVPALVADTSGLAELAQRGLATAIPTDSGADAIGDAIVAQLRQPPEVPRVGLPSWEDCASSLLALYGDVTASRGVSG